MKKLKRRPFPYLRVLRLWKAGKTLEIIARAIGRYQKDAADPLHAFRVSLTRFHQGVKIDGRLVKLPHRVSRAALKAATKAGALSKPKPKPRKKAVRKPVRKPVAVAKKPTVKTQTPKVKAEKPALAPIKPETAA